MKIRNYGKGDQYATNTDTLGGGIHPYYEILFISSGKVMLKWMGNVYPVSAPSLFLITPNTPHQLDKVSTDCSFWYVELDMERTSLFPTLHNILMWNDLQCQTDHHLIPNIELIYETVHMLSNLDINAHNIYSESIAMLDIRKLLLLIDHFLARYHDQKSTLWEEEQESSIDHHTPDELIHALMRFIEAKYKEDITLQMLAKYAHLDASYLIRLFKDHTEMTPFQYLHQLRMQAAECYLIETNMSVQDISHSIGYNSIHYFSRVFKKNYGQSPSQWRKLNQVPETIANVKRVEIQ